MISAAASAMSQAFVQPQLPSLPSLPSSGSASSTASGAASGAANGARSGFGNVLADAVGSLEQKQRTADVLAVQAATGELRDVQDYVIAATEAQVATELAVNVRNRAVEAFTQIMQMAI